MVDISKFVVPVVAALLPAEDEELVVGHRRDSQGHVMREAAWQ